MGIEKIKDRLQELRVQNGLTQKKMAEILGINPATFSAYESGKSNPSIYVMMDLSEKFGVSLDWLCGNSENKKDIETYSDIINALYEISIKTELRVVDLHDNCCAPTFHDVRFYSRYMLDFIEEWGKMLNLYNKKTIDKKLYKLWIEDKKKESDFKIKPYYPRDDIDLLDDRPIETDFNECDDLIEKIIQKNKTPTTGEN